MASATHLPDAAEADDAEGLALRVVPELRAEGPRPASLGRRLRAVPPHQLVVDADAARDLGGGGGAVTLRCRRLFSTAAQRLPECTYGAGCQG